MKKIIAVVLLAAVIALTGCADQKAIVDFIGTDAAKKMVLQATGIDISDAKILSIDLKNKNGIEYYQVAIETSDGKYRFDIDALTGRIIDKKELKADEEVKEKTDKALKKEEKIEKIEKPKEVEISSDVNKEVSSKGNRVMISAAEAKEIALEHAKLAKDKVTFVKNGFDKDDGHQVYDIEFYDKDLNEYDYEIDAYTGAILDYDFDAEYYRKPEVKIEKEKDNNSDIISAGAAKKIALEHAGLDESEVKFVKRKLSESDGVRIYEIEFYTDDAEYDYEINAITGKIIDYDYDAEDYESPKKYKKEKNNKDKNSKSNSKSVINETQAKKKALAQVPGAKLSNIVEFEADYDDGRIEYEGKIYYKNMEYEFEIDGYSGAIRSWDAEPIND